MISSGCTQGGCKKTNNLRNVKLIIVDDQGWSGLPLDH